MASTVYYEGVLNPPQAEKPERQSEPINVEVFVSSHFGTSETYLRFIRFEDGDRVESTYHLPKEQSREIEDSLGSVASSIDG
jgi:hypothetical protein